MGLSTFTEQKCDLGIRKNKFGGPKQFAVVAVSSMFVNRAPVFSSSRFYTMEENGGTMNTVLTAIDPEGDEVFFKLDESHKLPLGGNTTLEPNGTFAYKPCINCYGTEKVRLEVVEYRCDARPALSTSVELIIEVRPSYQHHPIQFVLSSGAHLLQSERTGEIHVVVDQGIAYYLVIGAYHISGRNMEMRIINDNRSNQNKLSHTEQNPALYMGTCGEDLSGKMAAFINSMLGYNNITAKIALPIPCDLHQSIHAPMVDPGIVVQVLTYLSSGSFIGLEQIKVRNSASHIVVVIWYVCNFNTLFAV